MSFRLTFFVSFQAVSGTVNLIFISNKDDIPVIDNLLPENEQFLPNDTNMNVSQEYLTWLLRGLLPAKQSLVILKTPRYPRSQQFRYEPGPGCESFHLHTIHLLRQVGDVLIESRVISRV